MHMIDKDKMLKDFKREKIPFRAANQIFESLWKEAVALKIFPPRNPLEGIEIDVKIAKILNSCSKS